MVGWAGRALLAGQISADLSGIEYQREWAVQGPFWEACWVRPWPNTGFGKKKTAELWG